MRGRLSEGELDLLSWVLPEGRRGYREALEKIRSWGVIAQGRRGEGHWVLGEEGIIADHESPLASVLAEGVVRYESGERHVTVREPSDLSIDVEFSGAVAGLETGRWTLSTWLPAMPCPLCLGPVREVVARTVAENEVVLAVCPKDRRLWVFDSRRDISLPVPVTLFHSEVMRQTGVKDPTVALSVARFFESLHTFSDEQLLGAFIRYNDIRAKVSTTDRIVPPQKTKNWYHRILSFFTGRP